MHGFDPFVSQWHRVDVLLGKAVQVEVEKGLIVGIARGINSRGALIIETTQGIQEVIAGEVERVNRCVT